jgi:DNA-binding MarR family transcriptional regulator
VRYTSPRVSLQPTPWGTPIDVINAVRRVNKLLRRRFDRSLDGLFISYAQYEVLTLLAGDRNLHAAAVAREMRITPQAVQKLIEKLVVGGLVDTDPPDGGVLGLRITHEGHARLRLADAALADVSRRIQALDVATRAQLVDALGNVEGGRARPPARGDP